MSAEATGWVWNYSPYTGAQLLVHLAIADVVNDAHGNEFWMSTDSLARKAKVSRSTVTATLSDMVDRQLLALIEAGGVRRKPSRYRFTSALTDTTSAIRSSQLARSPVTNSNKTNEQRASAVSGLVRREPDQDCKRCQGTGITTSPRATCPCVTGKTAQSA